MPHNPNSSPKDKNDARVAAKFDYTKKKGDQGKSADDDFYEVYCDTCGKPHNNPAFEVGHCCRDKKSRVTPWQGKIVAAKPPSQETEGEEAEEQHGFVTPTPPNTKHAKLFARQSIVTVAKEQSKAEQAVEEGDVQKPRHEMEEQLAQQKSSATPNLFLFYIGMLKESLDKLPKVKAKAEAGEEEPKEDDPQTAAKAERHMR